VAGPTIIFEHKRS